LATNNKHTTARKKENTSRFRNASGFGIDLTGWLQVAMPVFSKRFSERGERGKEKEERRGGERKL